MVTESDVQQFHRDGYLLVRDVLSQEEVERLRSFLLELFDKPSQHEGDNETVRHDVCARYPDTRFLLSHPKVVDALKKTLGDNFVFLPEMSAHNAFFSTWHKDTTSQEVAGHDFHWDDDFLMVETGFYLQDNGPHGGGLDVIPGSHKIKRSTFLQKVRGRFDRRFRRKAVPTKAGDLVIFNFNVDHQATKPTAGEAPSGAERKLAIFLAASRNNEHVEKYKQFIAGRDEYAYLQGHSYPQELIDTAREKEYTLA